MDLLESMQPDDIKGQLIWCYYEEEKPSQRIINLVSDLNGVLVPVPDFDLLMVLLGEKMGIALMDDQIGNRATKRAERYRDRILRLDTVKHPSVTRALAATLERAGGWWSWEQKVRLEKDPARKEIIYRQAIELCQKSYELHGNFALCLWKECNNPDEAERAFLRALELNPKHANTLCNYASFLRNERKNNDQAEQFYKRAIEADPKHASSLGNYARFLTDERKDIDQAEQFYKRAIEADPKNTTILGIYARFLADERKDIDRAEQFYKRAIEADPRKAINLGNYAHFLLKERKDTDKAKQFYKRAIEADPRHANTVGNYAQLLFITSNDGEACGLLNQALMLQPSEDALKVELCFYRLAHIRKDWPKELLTMKALLTKGARSADWDFSGNINRAKEAGHLNLELLQAIADVISKNTPIETLDKFPEWQKAV